MGTSRKTQPRDGNAPEEVVYSGLMLELKSNINVDLRITGD